MSESAITAAPTSEAISGETDEIGPLRRCIASGARLPKEAMIRFVVGPDAEIVPDLAGSLPGRGLWLRADRDSVAVAAKKRSFERGAKRQVTVAEGLGDRIEILLAARCRDAIGLARRSGGAVAGYEKVRDFLRAGRAGLALAACDGADDGRRKIAGLAAGLPIVDALSADELGAAFGRERVVHAALAPGPLAERLRHDAARLSGFRRAKGS